MKKLIAISVIFALVAGAAFAELSVGGQLQIGTTLLSGNSDADDVNMGGQKAHEAKAKFSFGDGESGGQFGINASGDWLPPATNHLVDNAWGFMYWRPVEAFRIQVGNNPDGNFGTAQISGWGFTAEAKNSVGAVSDYAGGLYMAERVAAWWDGTGAAANVNMSFFPTDTITINVVLPMAASQEASAMFARLALNAVIGLEDVGKIFITFEGTGGLEKDVDTVSVGNLYASFFLNSLDGMDVDFGVKFGIPFEGPGGVDVNPGLNVGVGFAMTGDGFGFKARVGAGLGAGSKAGDVEVKAPTTISVGLLPYFMLDALTLYVHVGLGMQIPDEGESVTDWFFNPYISVPAGNIRFYMGLQVWQRGITDGADPAINFSIPFGFNCYF